MPAVAIKKVLRIPVKLKNGKEAISFNLLSQRVGVSLPSIMVARDKGWIKIHKHKGVECALWPDAKDQYLSKASIVAGPKPKKERNLAQHSDDEEENLPRSNRGAKKKEGGLNSYSASKVKYESEIKRLDLEERMGKLVPLEAVKSMWGNIADTTKKALKSIPDRISSVLAGEMDEHKIFILLNKEIDQALKNLEIKHEYVEADEN